MTARPDQAGTSPAPLEMDPQIRAGWAERLRSGQIPQGRACLNDGKGGRCCLGVLSDMAVEAGVIPPPERVVGNRWLYGTGDDADEYCLPDVVVRWAGLKDSSPDAPGDPCGPGRQARLTELNDGTGFAEGKPWTFAQIADLIEGGAR